MNQTESEATERENDEGVSGDGVSEDDGEDEVVDDDYRQTVSQLVRVSAPPTFSVNVEETIRQRSGGRFFGRRAFGDRVPYELVIAIVILVLGLGAYLVLRSSSTGSLRYRGHDEAPMVAPDAEGVVPQPEPID